MKSNDKIHYGKSKFSEMAQHGQVKIDLAIFFDREYPKKIQSAFARILAYKLKRYQMLPDGIQKEMVITEINTYCYDRALRYSAFIDKYGEMPIEVEYMTNNPNKIKSN